MSVVNYMPMLAARRVYEISRQTKHAAGADLEFAGTSPITIYPMNPLRDFFRSIFGLQPRPHIAKVPLGIAVEVPVDHELQLRPRSGLAIKHGITLLNSPGTIDADYRDELCAILINLGNEPFIVEPGMRICQAVLAKLTPPVFSKIDKLSYSERKGGFGSTGLK